MDDGKDVRSFKIEITFLLALFVFKIGCGRALPGGEPKYKYKARNQ